MAKAEGCPPLQGLVSASQLAPQPDTSQAQLSLFRVPTEAKAKSLEEWWASFGEPFPISASVTADCCQWGSVIGPLPWWLVLVPESSLKNASLGKRHSLCVRHDYHHCCGVKPAGETRADFISLAGPGGRGGRLGGKGWSAAVVPRLVCSLGFPGEFQKLLLAVFHLKWLWFDCSAGSPGLWNF